MEKKKETKERTSMTLKPINKAWLAKKSLEESTPADKVSASEIVDRLIDEARLREESQSPTQKKRRATDLQHVVTLAPLTN